MSFFKILSSFQSLASILCSFYADSDSVCSTSFRFVLFSRASLASSSSSNAGEVVKEILSDPFTVYSAKKYPGMTESSQLVKLLASQNINVPVRNDVRRGRE